MADGSTYGTLDLSFPKVTSRTRLYHQRPLGIGTHMVESLTGYIVRLAYAHVVSPGILIFKELWHVIGTCQSGSESSHHCYSSFVYDAYTLNGVSESAEKWAAAVGIATGVESVRFLTMLPWKHALSMQGLTRTKRAWCASCYQEWRMGSLEIYEPLLWMLTPVSICLLHRRPLTTVCPHCRREPHVLSCRARPGHCSRCGQWLGVEHGQPTDSGGTADFNYARSTSEMVATLIARAPVLERPPSVEVLKINLQACLEDLAEGNKSLFLRAVGIGQKTVEQWLRGRMLPTLGNLLKICSRLGIPLLRFVTEPITSGGADWEHAKEVVRRFQSSRSRRVPVVRAAIEEALHAPEPRALSAIALKVGFKHAKTLQAYDPESCRAISDRYDAMMALKGRSDAANTIPSGRVEKTFEIALRQVPPPSIGDVSLSLGLQRASWLVKRFPEHCRSLVQRSREYRQNRRLEIENVLRTALTEDPPPTIKELAKRIGHSGGSTLRAWFPDLYGALVARSLRRHDWRLAKIRPILEAALMEEPPPSGESVAARVGINSSYVCKLFPHIWRELVARHATHKAIDQAKNRQVFQEEVRKIAQELLTASKYPSRRRVRSLIRESSLKGDHLIAREVKKVVDELPRRPLAFDQQSSSPRSNQKS